MTMFSRLRSLLAGVFRRGRIESAMREEAKP